MEALQEAERENDKLKLQLAAQKSSVTAVLEALYNIGHNDDCSFCRQKDELVLRAAENWGMKLEIIAPQ